MCKGLGLDLCGISRMEPLLADGRFLERYFTGAEADYIRSRGAGAAQSMAGIWAAKEALMKAAGRGLTLPLREIEVCHGPAGEPFYRLHGSAAQTLPGNFLLSITHEGDMAAAVCLWTEG